MNGLPPYKSTPGIPLPPGDGTPDTWRKWLDTNICDIIYKNHKYYVRGEGTEDIPSELTGEIAVRVVDTLLLEDEEGGEYVATEGSILYIVGLYPDFYEMRTKQGQTVFGDYSMVDAQTELLKEDSRRSSLVFFSDRGMAKKYIESGQLSEEEYGQLESIDPSPNRKYLGWLAKIYVQEHPDLNELRNYVTEFHTLVGKGRPDTKDIYSLKTFDELQKVVDEANVRKTVSLDELKTDYEVIRDDADVLIVVPHTHEASRKLGLSEFVNRATGDCVWCTTYGNAGHFNSYYYSSGITFYYVKVRSPEMLSQLKTQGYDLSTVAILVYQDGRVEAQDAKNQTIPTRTLNKFRKVVGLWPNSSLLSKATISSDLDVRWKSVNSGRKKLRDGRRSK